MDHRETDLRIFSDVKLGYPVMGPAFPDMLAAGTTRYDVEVCSFFGDQNIMDMLDFFLAKIKAGLDREDIIAPLVGDNHVSFRLFGIGDVPRIFILVLRHELPGIIIEPVILCRALLRRTVLRCSRPGR